MRKGIYLLALAPLAFVGCASEPTTVTTTTTTQEVTTAGPTREVIVTRTPPAVRVETQTVAPGTGYVWTRGYWRWSWRRLYVGAGKLGRASKAGGNMGGRPVGAQGRRLGVDAGSLAISRGEQGPGFGPTVKIQTSCIVSRLRCMRVSPN